MKLESIKNRLKEHGLKATIQRLAIYDSLLNTKKHPSAEDIYNVVNDKHPGISLSTVYNTLEIFVSKNLVKKVSNDFGSVRYDAILEPHHHMICENTNTITDYYDAELDTLLKDYFDKKELDNFNIDEIKIHIKGNFVK
jgi:Fur family peroxide stress response transcriptional regulator